MTSTVQPETTRIVDRNVRGRTIDWVSQYAAATTLVLVLVYAAVAAPSFYSSGNLRQVLLQTSSLGVVVAGQTLALLVRGVDMSVSAVALVTAVFVVSATDSSQSILYLVLALVCAVVVGLINGGLVVFRGVPPFIATFAALIVVGGAELAYTSGQASGNVPQWARDLGSQGWGVPYATMTWAAAVIVLFAVLTFTTWGRWVYAVGSNPAAARHAGVPVGFVTISAYVICAVSAMVGGLLLSGYLGYVDQTVGTSLSLNSITAAILGGVAFSGGRGGVIGAAVGAILMSVLVNVVIVAGLATYWQFVVVGVALGFAVTIQGLRDRWRPDSS